MQSHTITHIVMASFLQKNSISTKSVNSSLRNCFMILSVNSGTTESGVPMCMCVEQRAMLSWLDNRAHHHGDGFFEVRDPVNPPTHLIFASCANVSVSQDRAPGIAPVTPHTHASPPCSIHMNSRVDPRGWESVNFTALVGLASHSLRIQARLRLWFPARGYWLTLCMPPHSSSGLGMGLGMSTCGWHCKQWSPACGYWWTLCSPFDSSVGLGTCMIQRPRHVHVYVWLAQKWFSACVHWHTLCSPRFLIQQGFHNSPAELSAWLAHAEVVELTHGRVSLQVTLPYASVALGIGMGLPLVAEPAPDPLVDGGGEVRGVAASRAAEGPAAPAGHERGRAVVLVLPRVTAAPRATRDPPEHIDVPIKQDQDQGIQGRIGPRYESQELVDLGWLCKFWVHQSQCE